jgi:hypothetical protein
MGKWEMDKGKRRHVDLRYPKDGMNSVRVECRGYDFTDIRRSET